MHLKLNFDVAEAKAFFMTYWDGAPSDDEVYTSARNATVQRGYVYSAQADDNAKATMWEDYKSFVEGKKPAYVAGGVSEAKHVDNIRELVEVMTKKHSASLNEGRFRFGSAQKIFNLTLKLFWVKDAIKEPPHATIDSYVANNVGEYDYAWTKSDSLDEYLKVIDRCHRVSKAYGLSLAQWELLFWNMTLCSASIK